MGRLRSLRGVIGRSLRALRSLRLHRKYRAFTMARAGDYWRNLLIVDGVRHVPGCVIECGVWRGGMSAGMAEVLGAARNYYLFDSFEGLPPATAEDGAAAAAWQGDVDGSGYYDNCRAPIEAAQQAMAMSGAPRHHIVKGWFERTLAGFVPPEPIAVLRLDGDWYESTLVVLEALYDHVAPGGIVIVDDYYTWDGCSRAVHDFLSRRQSAARIRSLHGICVIEPRIQARSAHA